MKKIDSLCDTKSHFLASTDTRPLGGSQGPRLRKIRIRPEGRSSRGKGTHSCPPHCCSASRWLQQALESPHFRHPRAQFISLVALPSGALPAHLPPIPHPPSTGGTTGLPGMQSHVSPALCSSSLPSPCCVTRERKLHLVRRSARYRRIIQCLPAVSNQARSSPLPEPNEGQGQHRARLRAQSSWQEHRAPPNGNSSLAPPLHNWQPGTRSSHCRSKGKEKKSISLFFLSQVTAD